MLFIGQGSLFPFLPLLSTVRWGQHFRFLGFKGVFFTALQAKPGVPTGVSLGRKQAGARQGVPLTFLFHRVKNDNQEVHAFVSCTTVFCLGWLHRL